MALQHSPSIVTSGLVLCLDAASPRSYPGSGTTWYDATTTGYNATLINGPTYYNGYFTFDGVNDIATIPNNTALDTQTPSVEVWVKTNATTQNGFWFEKGSVNSQYALFQEGANITWRLTTNVGSLVAPAASYINTSSWAHVVATYTSGDRRIYVNGVQIASDTLAYTIPTNNNGMSIGAYGGTSGTNAYWYNGALSVCRVYNKALTPAEILQNFNALRGRYGV